MPLVSLVELKQYMRIPEADTSVDTVLTVMRDAVELQFVNLIGWHPERRTYSEIIDGIGDVEICLATPFVVSVENVWVRSLWDSQPNVFSDSEKIDVNSYRLVMDRPMENFIYSSGRLQRIGAFWPDARIRRPGRLPPLRREGMGNIKVDYTAGFTAIPADIKFLVMQIVKQQWNSRPQGGLLVTSESHNDYSYTLGDLLAQTGLGSAQRTVNTYRRRALFG